MLTCPYCGNTAELVTGVVRYPHRPDLSEKLFYQCLPCDAYVGCHPGTDKPLGRMANAELRVAKVMAHRAFDPLWQSGYMARRVAYKWLAYELDMANSACHIGMFDVEQCKRVVAVCKTKNLWTK